MLGQIARWFIFFFFFFTNRFLLVWVKGSIRPVLTRAAEAVLGAYYQLQYGAARWHAARPTLRVLESLLQVSAGEKSRLMAHDTVVKIDPEIAVALLDASVMVNGDSVLEIPPGFGLTASGDGCHSDPNDAYVALD